MSAGTRRVYGWEDETPAWRMDYMDALAALDREFPAALAITHEPHTVGIVSSAVMLTPLNEIYRKVWREMQDARSQA